MLAQSQNATEYLASYTSFLPYYILSTPYHA